MEKENEIPEEKEIEVQEQENLKQEQEVKEEFKEYGIDLYFIKMDNIEYKQFSNEFIPNLSIIDVLMHNGKEGTKELLNKYTLV